MPAWLTGKGEPDGLAVYRSPPSAIREMPSPGAVLVLVGLVMCLVASGASLGSPGRAGREPDAIEFSE